MLESVIIPTLNEAERIETCIVSAAAAGAGEIVVVDGGSTDGTVAIASGRATVIFSRRGRSWQMNAGAAHARGEILLFLHADTLLPPGAIAELESIFEDQTVSGYTFRLRFDLDHPMLSLYGWFTRLRPLVFHYGDQGIAIRRNTFETLNGLKPIPLMEDVEILARVRRLGRVMISRLSVTTSARRFVDNGIVRQQLLNIMIVCLYHCGVRPETFATLYRSSGGSGERLELGVPARKGG